VQKSGVKWCKVGKVNDSGGKLGISHISHLPTSEIPFFSSPGCRAHVGLLVGHPLTPANRRARARLGLDTSRGGADLGIYSTATQISQVIDTCYLAFPYVCQSLSVTEGD
jgi:hypothetical protein